MNYPNQSPPLQPPAMSKQNSDSVVPGGLDSALGGVLTGVWGSYKSTNASLVVVPPSPPKLKVPEPARVPTPGIEIADLSACELV
jgi:hypothetical protein